jgi:hypothetical protein
VTPSPSDHGAKLDFHICKNLGFLQAGLIFDEKNIQRNLGITNLKGPKMLFFIAGVLLLQGLFTMKLTTEGLRIKFFIAGILLLKGSLYRGFSVNENISAATPL